MIQEEAEKSTNAKIGVLAQGDNQVICMSFKPQYRPGDKGWTDCVNSILSTFDSFMYQIGDGARKLGLIIKAEESWTSHRFMIYGKTLFSEETYYR